MVGFSINFVQHCDSWEGQLVSEGQIVSTVHASDLNSLMTLLRSKVMHFEFEMLELKVKAAAATLW